MLNKMFTVERSFAARAIFGCFPITLVQQVILLFQAEFIFAGYVILSVVAMKISVS
jgi:hypothetical protein